MSELLFKDEVYAITGTMFEVYKTLGMGFLEPVYQEALSIEFIRKGVPFEREKPLELYYKDVRLEKRYVADFVCFNQIILELKVLPKLTNIEMAQLLNYLKITKTKLGILANFGASPRLEWKRYIL
ncbi:MAG: GxxExxY protein [Acidobacteria bacterium]|nr:MAG: GxxExxY protein [Acidobacteriota bacterium]